MNSVRPTGDISSPSPNKSGFQVTIRDIIVDVIAALLPGYVFIVAAVPAFVMPLIAAIGQMHGTHSSVGQLILGRQFSSLVEPFRVEILITSFIVAYVIGQLFYRQDPKTPDHRSVQRSGIRKDGAVRVKRPPLCDFPYDEVGFNRFILLFIRIPQPRFIRERLKQLLRTWRPGAFVRAEQVEFPYAHLKEYLEARGLFHLSKLITWSSRSLNSGPDKNKTTINRTKQFINLLKIRLEFEIPDRYNQIARNEAHVRLMSSVWYCARALVYVGLLGIVCGEIANISIGRPGTAYRHLEFVFIPLGMVVAARIVQDAIEQVFHYQRIREIFFVLETAHWAAKSRPHLLDEIAEPETKEQADCGKPTLHCDGAAPTRWLNHGISAKFESSEIPLGREDRPLPKEARLANSELVKGSTDERQRLTKATN